MYIYININDNLFIIIYNKYTSVVFSNLCITIGDHGKTTKYKMKRIRIFSKVMFVNMYMFHTMWTFAPSANCIMHSESP